MNGKRDNKKAVSPEVSLAFPGSESIGEGFFLTTFAQAGIGIVITDCSGTILWCNSAAGQMTGYSSEELIGKRPSLLKSGVHPSAFYADIWNTIRGGSVWRGQVVNRRKDGSLYTEEMTVTPVRDENGNISHYIAIKDDISDRKRGEREVINKAAFFENNPDPVLRISQVGRVIEANPAAIVLFGNQIVGNDITSRIPDFPAAIRDAIKTPNRPIKARFALDERTLLFSVVHRPEHGSVYVFGTEITALVEAERSLQQLNDVLRDSLDRMKRMNLDLQLANRHKSRFLSVMSHELRTPLNSIIGFAELLLGCFFGALNERQTTYVRQVLDNGRHLLELINDLLDMAKIESGSVDVTAEPLDLSEIVPAVAAMVRVGCERKRIALRLDIPETLPRIRGDRRRLRQILLNLLSNAVKYTPENGEITIRSSFDGSMVRVEVCDTGIGIGPADQSRIFDEFEQVDRARDEQLGGTGIGLALTKRLVEIQGGTIGLRSVPGIGSVFHFSLPVQPLDSEEKADTLSARQST